jgi:hypothetical protein
MSITTENYVSGIIHDPRFIAWYSTVPGHDPRVTSATSTADQLDVIDALYSSFPDLVHDRVAQFMGEAWDEADYENRWIDAHAENMRRDLARLTSPVVIVESPTDEVKIERAARELDATPDQLARLRVLVQAERDLVRVQRERDDLLVERDRLALESIERYDPRMRPMLEDLARLAVERSFCSEFDLVLDHIGGPSRDELNPRITSGHHHVTVTLSIPIEVDDVENDGVDREDIMSYLQGGEFTEDEIHDWTVTETCTDGD